MMRTWRVFLLFGCSFLCGLLTCVAAQGVFPSTINTLPEPQVWLLGKAVQDDKSALRLAVQIPEDHHGYLDTGDEGFYIPLSFSFPTPDPEGIRLVSQIRPQGKRDEIAHATVLRGYGEFQLQVEGPRKALQTENPLPILFRYQICNDVTKICYPPREIALSLVPVQDMDSPAAFITTPERESQPPKATLTANERLYALFRNYTHHPGWAFMLVCAAGLLAVATPCVYPMLPITAAIFTARGQGSRYLGQLHALVYCLGLISFYALMGLLATTTGTALSALMTNTWVHIGFAFIFAYLGLSMFGVFTLQFLPELIARLDTLSNQWKGMTGTFCMGATTGLVVSPCVGPITGTILLDIAGQVASTDTGRLFRGVFLMSGFGVGLCVPFLGIGLLSSTMPQSGTWLTKTRYLLAFPTFYFSYSYYIKGMEIAAVPLSAAHVILIGLLAIIGAVLLGVFYAQKERPQSAHPLRVLLLPRGMALAMLIIGTYALYQGIGQSDLLRHIPFLYQSPAVSQAIVAETAIERQANLRWLRSFSSAQQQARAEKKPLFVDFYAAWCANCKAFQKLAETDPQLNTALQRVVLVKIYDTDPVFALFQQETHYPELRGIGGQPLLPLFAIYSAQGALVWKGQDYQAVSTMVAQLAYAQSLANP